jgi:hypothetical protein
MTSEDIARVRARVELDAGRLSVDPLDLACALTLYYSKGCSMGALRAGMNIPLPESAAEPPAITDDWIQP